MMEKGSTAVDNDATNGTATFNVRALGLQVGRRRQCRVSRPPVCTPCLTPLTPLTPELPLAYQDRPRTRTCLP